MTRMFPILIVAALLAGAATVVLADDFSPAPWRGDPLTYAAEWNFVNPVLTDLPPSYANSVGDGIHLFNVDCYVHTHPQNVYWEQDPTDPNDGRAYTGALPGTLDFFLCNWIDGYPYKYVWVQLTYGGEGIPFVYQTLMPNPTTNEWTNAVEGARISTAEGPGQRTEFWYFPYNPDREYVNVMLPPNTWLDQIWIETISTLVVSEEPTSWGQLKGYYR